MEKALEPKKNAKLKKSSNMGNLYRILKGKVEASSLNSKQTQGGKLQLGKTAGSKKEMADALAEMTKRSAYFKQIEEDVKKHAKSIMEIKDAINLFKTKDMVEIVKFYRHVEKTLEKLTDETQVLSKFEGFPIKKLEAVRTAATLYLKLKEIVDKLEKWNVMPPLEQNIGKIESYFHKIKAEIDALEANKDEESKRFQSNDIHFDFNILVRIKELMVDVSSSCMEVALKERKETKAAGNGNNRQRNKGRGKVLWRAFKLAFEVYSFAGGKDDRAGTLSRELAHEIQTDPQPDLCYCAISF